MTAGRPRCIAHVDENCMECIFTGAPHDRPFPPPDPPCSSCGGTGDQKPGASCLAIDNPPCAVCGGTGGRPAAPAEAARLYAEWQTLSDRLHGSGQ